MARTRAHKISPAPRALDREEALIARAEAAVVELSSHFSGWMDDECLRLEGLYRRVEAAPADLIVQDKLFRTAHDIKGEAATFGFPLVERIAASLCQLVSNAADRTRIPPALIGLHVAAIRQATRVEREGDVLAADVERAAAQYLSDAYNGEDCPRIESPPLAP